MEGERGYQSEVRLIRCAHGVLRGEGCGECAINSRELTAAEANEMLFGRVVPSPDRVRERTEDARAAAENSPNPASELAALDYLEGTAAHDWANAKVAHMRSFIGLKDGERATTMSREDVEAAYDLWEEREEFEALEKRAADSYERSAGQPWGIDELGRGKNLSLGVFDLLMQKLDLEWRAATRISDAEERGAALQRLDAQYAKATGHLDTKSRRAEYQVVSALRAFIEANDIEHVVSVEHALPRNDFNEMYRQDVVVRILGEEFPVQLKTEFPSDSYLQEHYEAVREQTKRKLAASSTDTAAVVVDMDALPDAMKAIEAGSAARLRPFVEGLLRQMPEKVRGELLPFAEKKEKATAKKVRTVTEKDLQNYLTAPKLVELGFLSVAERGQASAVLKAKKDAVSELLARKAKTDQLGRPDFEEEIRGSRAA